MAERWLRNELMEFRWDELQKRVNEGVFGHFHRLEKCLVPSYAINVGPHSCPSKLFFFDEPLWSAKHENQRLSFTTLMNGVKAQLEKKIAHYLGNAIPNKTSAHFLLHRVIAAVLSETYPDGDHLHDQMLVDCLVRLARTRGRGGNIYANYVFPVVVATIEDFLCFRRQTENCFDPTNDAMSRTFGYKLLCELAASGIDYDGQTDQIFFDVSKLKRPTFVDVENSSIDFQVWKQRVQQCYLSARNLATAQLRQSCFTLEIQDFIEFAFQLSADELLPIWAE